MTPEELLKEVGKPVACVDARDWEWHANNSPETTLGVWTTSDWKRKLNLPNQVPMFFYTSDQVAAAILKATNPLEDKLAKAEQRVAELIPGNGKELSERMKRLATNSVWRYSEYQNKPVDMSDPNIQELFTIIDHLCIGLDSPSNGASS